MAAFDRRDFSEMCYANLLCNFLHARCKRIMTSRGSALKVKFFLNVVKKLIVFLCKCSAWRAR